ncbi:hypothetical protein T484DRAFT_1607831, partial [Baffinella frigidus]
TLHPTPYPLHPQPSTLNPQPSTLNPQPSTLKPPPGEGAGDDSRHRGCHYRPAHTRGNLTRKSICSRN